MPKHDKGFCRIQNLHISQTLTGAITLTGWFCRIQNLHISQTYGVNSNLSRPFCRIQNLHISQTAVEADIARLSFVEFKIYISLKLKQQTLNQKQMFCRIQNLHISQTQVKYLRGLIEFCRIQNLHISQTVWN